MEWGCFCCLQTFPAPKMIEWIDDGDTPPRPQCSITTVLPGVTDLVELFRLRERRFGFQTGVTLPDEEL